MEKGEITISLEQLRRKAGQVIEDQSDGLSGLSTDDIRQLLRQLLAQQTKLEEQNDELRNFNDKHDQMEDKLQIARAEAHLQEETVSALLESFRAIQHQRDFETSTRSIFDSCKRLIGATAGYVVLLTDDGGENEIVFLDTGGETCTVDPTLPMPIRGMREAADQAYLHMRAGLEAFNPSTCEDLVLVLKPQAEAIGERANFQVHVDSHCDRLVLDPQVRREILLVFNEAIHNVEKHAQANHLSVRLYREADELCMQIEDDGIGFDLDEYFISQNGHYGLANMRERTEQINGRLLIESTPGDGTAVSLRVPLSSECVESP